MSNFHRKTSNEGNEGTLQASGDVSEIHVVPLSRIFRGLVSSPSSGPFVSTTLAFDLEPNRDRPLTSGQSKRRREERGGGDKEGPLPFPSVTLHDLSGRTP